MRIGRILVALALSGCGNKSKLDTATGGDTDALWDLAPDGVEVGVVASPRAIELAFGAVATIQHVAAMPDFAPMRPQIDAIVTALLGNPTATPADAGLATDRGFAMFITADGVLGVMPVADRTKFMAVKHGQRAGAGSDDVDHLNGNSCKPLRDHYVCATNDKLFDRLGKASLRGKVALAGGRGDVELYAPSLPLFDGTAGELALAVEVDRGQIAVRGKWTGTPGGTLGQLAGVIAPHPDTAGAAGFVAVDLAKLLGGLPPVPLAADITFAQLGASLAGPVSALIPSGSVDIQVHAPLVDPAPAKTLLEQHCKELDKLLDLADTQPPNACRFKLQSATLLELEAWVDGKELRVAAHRDAQAKPTATELTPIGKELAAGMWTAAFWGRGTMLNLTGITPSKVDLPPPASAAIHAISLVNELGVGLRVDKDGVTLRGVLRTVWANPAELAAKIVAISGDDIVHGKATEPGQALAASHGDAPFAADFAAGQGGLMVPAAALGIASAIIVPAIDSLLGGGDEPPAMQPMPTDDLPPDGSGAP